MHNDKNKDDQCIHITDTCISYLTSAVLIRVKDTNPPTDCLSCTLVVTGDDNDPDPSVIAALDGVLDLNTGRVQHTNHTHKRHVTLQKIGKKDVYRQMGFNCVI